MRLIDTHCHIDFPVFEHNRDAVIAEAKEQSVTDLVVPGVVADKWQSLLALVNQNHSLHPALGLHPCFITDHRRSDIDLLAELLDSENVSAVGEIGLDLFIPEADLEKQLSYLKPQLELAKAHDLPVILHVRKAHDQILQQLRQFKLDRSGVVHAFSGSEQQADQYLELGFKLGIGGTITYERAKKLRRIVREKPLESFVLETDSPDIPLSGYQGEINFPKRVKLVAEEFAAIRECSVKEVAEVTTATACALFKSLR